MAVAHEKPAGEAIVVSAKDNVATALQDLPGGGALTVEVGPGELRRIVLRQAVDFGHKFALTAIAAGETIVKYGESIGRASRDIDPGEHVHVHNVESGRGRGDLQV